MDEEISNSRDGSQLLTQRIINSTTYIFMRSSAQFASPLISTLSNDSVSIGLNGTVVHCMDVVNHRYYRLRKHALRMKNGNLTQVGSCAMRQRVGQ